MQNNIEIKGKKMVIDEKAVNNYGGSVHYWRSKPEDWDKILEEVKKLGINLITTYIPWEIHEVEENVFDFGGSKNVDAFLSLCSKKGFNIMVRPGPQINSEMTWFGFPERILENPDLQAKNPFGGKVILTQVPKPIPALSYASPEFFKEVETWYDAICPILKNHLFPKGNIIGVQVDNELGYFFNVNPYTCDYSTASIELYRSFICEKYGTIENLNKIYKSNYSSFYEIVPPIRFAGTSKEDLPYYLDWIEYREYYLIHALEILSNMLKDRGIDVPIYHNYPHPLGPGGAKGAPSTPFNIPKLEEKIDFVGFDIYSRKELYDHIKTISSYVSGCSRYPFIPEFITGVWPWYINPGDVEDEIFDTKAVLMHGIKGFNRYMIVDRNKWLGSPINREGIKNEKSYELHNKVQYLLNKLPIENMKKKCDIMLLTNRDYDRLEAATALIPVYGDFLDPILGFSEYPNASYISNDSFGFKEPIQINKTRWFEVYYNYLSDEGYTFEIGDSELTVSKMKEYKVVILSTFEYLSEELTKKLIEYVKEGGNLIIGPNVPSFNELMTPSNDFKNFIESIKKIDICSENGMEIVGTKYFDNRSNGSIILVPDLKTIQKNLSNIFKELDVYKINKKPKQVDAILYESVNGENILFLCNPTSETIDTEVLLPTNSTSCYEIWDNIDHKLHNGILRLSLEPYTIKIFDIKVN